MANSRIRLSWNIFKSFKYYNIDRLKNMIDIKPKVIEDAITILDKFPCALGGLVLDTSLQYFVSVTIFFRANTSQKRRISNEFHLFISGETIDAPWWW